MVPVQVHSVFSILMARKLSSHLLEYDSYSYFSNPRDATCFVNGITCVVCCPISKPSWLVVGDDRGELEVVSEGLYGNFETPPYVAWSTHSSLSCEGF